MLNEKTGVITKIVVVDDHKLLCKALADLVDRLTGYRMLYFAHSGQELMEKLKSERETPDIILMDVNMYPVDGIEATKIISQKFPHIKVIAISMYEDEYNILEMFRAGARGYLMKHTSTEELEMAFRSVSETGYYHSELMKSILQKKWKNENGAYSRTFLTDREKEFMKLCCLDLTYKEIGNQMCISERTVESYRDRLLEKLNVKSKVGIVVYALSTGIANK